jgi:regulator of protease activity HflC (stomatin/prohibitin superfamily)
LKDHKSVYTVPKGYRGVQQEPVPPGTYYLNPYVENIVPVDIDMHQVEFGDIVFPSKDGFTIQPHVRVAYKVIPERAPELFVMLCDNGQLPQVDRTLQEQQQNPILQKFVLPLIRGWVRIEGSKYDARDYVSQQKGTEEAINPREQLRKILEEKVKPECEQVGVMIESITVAELDLNADLQKLAEQIFERERTRVTRDKNQKLVEQHKSEQEQKAKEALTEQRSKLVDANRDLKVAQTLAEQQKEVEEARLKNDLKAAEARLEAARELAKATITRGKAEAAVITAQNEAEVAGLKTAINGFPSPEQFAQYHILSKLSPALTEIFASDTSDFARLFATYMTPMMKSTPPARPAVEAKTPMGPAIDAGKPMK